MADTELLPCPWCGETPDVSTDASFRLTDGVKYGALQCCVVGPEVRTDYKDVPHWRERAIAAWNERKSPEATTAKNAVVRFDSKVMPWNERIGRESGVPDGVIKFAMLEEIAELREALASRPAEVDDNEQTDTKRLMFAMQDIDGFLSVKQDKYDLAVVVMEERGLDEPDWECELEGVRRLIDKAIGTST